MRGAIKSFRKQVGRRLIQVGLRVALGKHGKYDSVVFTSRRVR